MKFTLSVKLVHRVPTVDGTRIQFTIKHTVNHVPVPSTIGSLLRNLNKLLYFKIVLKCLRTEVLTSSAFTSFKKLLT